MRVKILTMVVGLLASAVSVVVLMAVCGAVGQYDSGAVAPFVMAECVAAGVAVSFVVLLPPHGGRSCR